MEPIPALGEWIRDNYPNAVGFCARGDITEEYMGSVFLDYIEGGDIPGNSWPLYLYTDTSEYEEDKANPYRFGR